MITIFTYRSRKEKDIWIKNKIIEEKNSYIKDRDEIIITHKLSLKKWLDIYNRMVLLSISPQKKKYSKFLEDYNKLFYNKEGEFSFKWDVFRDMINQVFNNYETTTKEKCSTLTTKEIQVILLQKAGFEIADIAILLDNSINTIYKRNSDIRKKLEAPDSANIIDYIDTKI